MSTAEYFEKLYAEYGDSPRALDWSAESQRARFRVLWEAGIQKHHSVLDVGCGLGHFVDYLREHGHSGVYEGLDVSKTLLEAARKRRPDEYFSKLDPNWLQRDERLPACDWVVSSGMLNVFETTDEHGHYLVALRLIDKMFTACSKGVAVNMLSVEAPMHRADRHYYNPMVMWNAAMRVTKKLALRHDYLPNDFTIFLYK